MSKDRLESRRAELKINVRKIPSVIFRISNVRDLLNYFIIRLFAQDGYSNKLIIDKL